MKRPPNPTAVAISLIAGGVILYLAVPRTMAAFTLLPTAPIFAAIQKGQKNLSQNDLLTLRDAQNRAYSWTPNGRTMKDRALVEMALARNTPGKPKRKQWYETAERTVETGFLKAPANPYAWARLAYLRLINGGENSGAHEALSMSLMTGPYERRMALTRVRYGLRLWHRLRVEERTAVEDQILIADRFNRSNLIDLARKDKRSKGIIFAAMAKDAERFNSFIQAFNKPPR